MKKYTVYCREDDVIFVADSNLDLVRFLVPVSEACKIIPEGKTSFGKPRNRWWDDI
jgi:hypothetical protein